MSEHNGDVLQGQCHVGSLAAALAVCIVKSKPDCVSVQNYVRRVLHKLKHAQEPDCIDVEAHSSSAEESCKAKDEQINDLRKEVGMLRAVVQSQMRTMQPEKHSANMEDVFTSTTHSQSSTVDKEPVPDVKTSLLTTIYIARRLLSSGRINEELLCHALHSIVTQVSELLLSISGTISLSLDASDLKKSCAVSLRAIAIVHDGLAHLPGDATDRVQRQLLARIVHFYHDLIKVVCEDDSHIVHNSNSVDDTAGILLSNTHRAVLGSILNGILQQLQPDLPSHRILFQGLLSAVLTTTGSQLYAATFGQKRASSIALEIEETSSRWQDLHQTSTRPLHQGARTILTLLEHVTGRASSFLDAEHGESAVHGMTSKLRERLQLKLVESVFGEDVKALLNTDVDPLDVTKTDKISASVQTAEMATDDDFVHAVWTVVGWDILAGNLR